MPVVSIAAGEGTSHGSACSAPAVDVPLGILDLKLCIGAHERDLDELIEIAV